MTLGREIHIGYIAGRRYVVHPAIPDDRVIVHHHGGETYLGARLFASRLGQAEGIEVGLHWYVDFLARQAHRANATATSFALRLLELDGYADQVELASLLEGMRDQIRARNRELLRSLPTRGNA